MKAYKLEILVVDHNGNGISDIINTIKNNKYEKMFTLFIFF